jgi:methionine aminotransferase
MIESSVPLHTKLPKVGDTIFTVMSALASKHGAINLSQGFPDFDIDERLGSWVNDAINDGKNQYAPRNGAPELLSAISGFVNKRFGVEYDASSEIMVSAGATEAIFSAISAILRPDDEAIVFTPAYDCYAPALDLVGAEVNYIKLKSESNFEIDWTEVKRKINRKTRLIILNSPHNPSGATITAKDIKELEKLTADKDIIILSDEVYGEIVFDDKKHHSVIASESLRARSIVVCSFGKILHSTGWKLGYALAPKAIMQEILKVHQYNVFSVNHPMQIAIARYLDEVGIGDLGAFYQKKRDLFLAHIDSKKFKCVPTAGSYFQLLDISTLLREGETDVDFAQRITIENKVATIPVSVFYNNDPVGNFVRVCFAKKDETIIEACKALNVIK